MARPHRTLLYDIHVRLGARMTEFSGWEMPVSYSGISEEHERVRTAVGLFDVSHMGQLEIAGTEAERAVQFLTLNDVTRIDDGMAQYSALANEEGGLVDDILVYRYEPNRYMLVVNAANIGKDFEWLNRHNRTGARIANLSETVALLAVQGPHAQSTLAPLTHLDLARMAPFEVRQTQIDGAPGTLSRTGYTGEDGFEFYFPVARSEAVWNAIMESGRRNDILPVGLGARNTLRLEARLLLYGRDIDETTTPFEAGLGWMFRPEKGDFVGCEALTKARTAGLTRKLVGFRMHGRDIARDNYPLFINGEMVGRVTSGGPSVSLKHNIGMAYLPIEHAYLGSRFQVQIRGRLADAEVVPTPFYTRSSH